jgi:DNA transformation protein and related proteins
MPRSVNTEFTRSKVRAPGADFAAHCCELMGGLGEVQAKRMFLGWGLSVEGLTVAVIAWDRLYLKANAQTQSQFLAAGCKVFEHESKGVTRRMQYYTAPDAALESRAAMQPWAALAMQAAVAARKPAKPVKPARGNGSQAAARATRSRASGAGKTARRS